MKSTVTGRPHQRIVKAQMLISSDGVASFKVRGYDFRFADMPISVNGYLFEPKKTRERNWLEKASQTEPSQAGCPDCVMELRIALRESVKLQAHYASLLNQWDGGQRMIFDNSEAWISRLRETNTLPPNDSSSPTPGTQASQSKEDVARRSVQRSG